MRTLGVALSLDCPSCGQRVPVGGVVESVRCGACQSEARLPPALWSLVAGHDAPFADTSGSGELGGISFAMRYALAPPTCAACRRPLLALSCPCGAKVRERPVPRDLAPAMHPAATHLIGEAPDARSWFVCFDEGKLASLEAAHRALGWRLVAAGTGVLCIVWAGYVLLEQWGTPLVPLVALGLGVALLMPAAWYFFRD